MDKLEVGEWYINEIGWHDFLLCTKIIDDIAYFKCVSCGEIAQTTQFAIDGRTVTEFFKPLETLTPSEALILLAHGFELKKNFDNKFNVFVKLSGNFIEAKHDNGGRYTVVNLMDTTNILVCPNEFTIHALPEGE